MFESNTVGGMMENEIRNVSLYNHNKILVGIDHVTFFSFISFLL